MRQISIALAALALSSLGAGAQAPVPQQPTAGPLGVVGRGGQTLLSIPATLGTTQAELDYQDLGASIQRLNDRVFVGAATVNDGTAARTGKDWVEALIPNTTNVAQFASISTIGGFGVLGASRSSDGGEPVGFAVGVAAFAVGDDTAHDHKTTTAFYAEARRRPGLPYDPGNARGNFVVAQENDIHNMAGAGSQVGTIDPYRMYQDLTAADTLLASGKPGLSTVDATVALGVVNNGSAFRHGIVFGATALTGDDGRSGTGSALAMGAGQQIEWYAPGSPPAVQAAIRSDIAVDAATAGGPQLIAFTPAGLALGSGGAPGLVVDTHGHLRTALREPAASACGLGAQLSGSDQAGLVRTGSGAQSCRITFAQHYGSVPFCVVSGQQPGRSPGYSLDADGITLRGVAGKGAYNYICFAQAGG